MGDTAAIPAGALQLGWGDIETLSVKLADAVAASGRTFGRLVVLPRGGLAPGNILARRLNMSADQVLSAVITSYETGAFESSGEFRVGQFPGIEEVKGLRLLVVDEVCDTGRTLAEAVRRLQELGAAEVVSAVLHYKPGRSTTGYVPDFYVDKTDEWIVYPWEWHEEPLRSSREADEPKQAVTV